MDRTPLEALRAALESVREACSDCGGKGWREYTHVVRVMIAPEAGLSDLPPNLRALAEDFRARYPGVPQTAKVSQTGRGDCWECDATGRVLTADGRAIIDILSELLRGKVEPAEHGHNLS